MLVPEDHGGGSISGQPVVELGVVAEAMGRAVAPGPFLACNLVAAAVAELGTGEQQAAVLPGIVTGEVVAAPTGAVLGEPGIALAAAPGGGLSLTGTASCVEAAGRADWFLVAAHGDAGPTLVLLPAGTDGVTVTPMGSLDLVRRLGRLRLDGVTVDPSMVLGEVGGAGPALERQLQLAAALQCAETVGIMGRVFDFTLAYVFDRHSFGRPLASYQALKHRIADQKLWLEASYAASAAAARAVGSGAPSAAELASAASSFVGAHATELVQECVQLHGGIGVTWEHDIHLYLRRATVNRALYGTPNEHRRRLATLLGA
jgi:alkylation response protein AidB-like acyl-CoA dehydrogenase